MGRALIETFFPVKMFVELFLGKCSAYALKEVCGVIAGCWEEFVDTSIGKLQTGVYLLQSFNDVTRRWGRLYYMGIHIFLHGVDWNVLYG